MKTERCVSHTVRSGSMCRGARASGDGPAGLDRAGGEKRRRGGARGACIRMDANTRAGRLMPLAVLVSFLLVTARGAESTSHSLRHHGAHRPPEPHPPDAGNSTVARQEVLFREGEDALVPCDLTPAPNSTTSSHQIPDTDTLHEEVHWFHDGIPVMAERQVIRSSSSSVSSSSSSSGSTSEVLRSLGFGDVGAHVLGDGAHSGGGNPGDGPVGRFVAERVGPFKMILRVRGAGRGDEGSWQCRRQGVELIALPVQLLMIEPPHGVYLSVDGRRVGAAAGIGVGMRLEASDEGGGARRLGGDEDDAEEDEDEDGDDAEEDEEEGPASSGDGVEVREDASITVRCVAEGGRPPPALSWLLDDRLASHASTDLSAPAAQTLSPQGIGIMVGSVGRGLHGARVSCVARHPALPSTLTASVKLNVLYSPSFGISREPGFGFPIMEGMPVSLKCDVDSNPPATPVWRKDNGDPGVPQSGDDGFLNFTSISREHSGWYKCTARHKFGLFSSIGYFLNVRYEADPGFPSHPIQGPPRRRPSPHDNRRTESPSDSGAMPLGPEVSEEEEEEPPTVHSVSAPLDLPQQQPQVVEVTLGGAVRLSCEGKDFAGPAPCWGRVSGGGRGGWEGGEGAADPLGEGTALALDRVLYGDAGYYECTPRRRKPAVEVDEEEARRQEARRTFKVVVTGRPVVYPANRTIKAAKGTRRLSFSVEFCAHPPHSAALWMFQPPPARLQPLRQGDAGEEEAMMGGPAGAGRAPDDDRMHLLMPPPIHHHRGPLLLWPGDRDHSRGLIAHNVTAGGSAHCFQSALTVREVSAETAGEYAFVVRSSEGVAQGLVHLELNGGGDGVGPYVPPPPPPAYQPPPPPLPPPPSFPASSLPSSSGGPQRISPPPSGSSAKDPSSSSKDSLSTSPSSSLFPSSSASRSPSNTVPSRPLLASILLLLLPPPQSLLPLLLLLLPALLLFSEFPAFVIASLPSYGGQCLFTLVLCVSLMFCMLLARRRQPLLQHCKVSSSEDASPKRGRVFCTGHRH